MNNELVLDLDKPKLSPRLQLILACLIPGEWVSVEKLKATKTNCPGTDVADLRKKGYRIDQRYNGVTEFSKRRKSEYMLLSLTSAGGNYGAKDLGGV
jgi:hypothetical protein